MNYDEYLKLEEERLEINKRHLLNGVDFLDMKTAYIDKKAIIGKGTIIYPNVILEGNVVIGEHCHIGQGSKIINSRIGEKTSVESSYIIDSAVGNKTSVGPFAYLRPNSNVGDGCKIGDFVEVKIPIWETERKLLICPI